MQKMMGGCPNSWWRQASEEASLLLHCPSSIALSSNSIPLTSWCEEHELPQTWSQLLMGGSVTHEEKCNLSCPLESQLNYNSQQGATDEVHDLKQEASEDSAYSFSHGSSRGNILNFSNKKADRKHHSLDHSSESNSTGNEGAVKKARVQGSSLSQSSNLKVRKEKVGDRITALHQLVSPFGKTDTASVLLEAFGYIRFLQSQIEALSSPYLARGSGNVRQPQDGNLEQKKDLRSRGLCLVPVSCTILQAENNINGADYWAPSIGGGF